MRFIERNQRLLLFSFWLLVQAALFFTYGVNATQESLKYIGAAEDLLYKGQLPETRYYFYLSTTLIIAFCIKTGLGYGGVVVIQLLLNLTATFYFYDALKKLQKNKLSAFVTVFLLISFLPYQTWNFFLYTESLFYSMLLLFFASCLRLGKTTKRTVLIQVCFLTFTVISRPLGIILLPCWFIYLAVQRQIRPVFVFTGLAVACLAAVIVINTIMSTISDWQILKPAEFGYIICDIPSRSRLELVQLKHHLPLTQLGLFIIQYPGEFLRLCAIRLKAFYLLTRSYYTTAHNLYLLFYAAIFTLPFLCATWLRKGKSFSKPLSLLSLLVVFGFTMAIMLQCDDYHNRFHHAITPIFLFGGIFLIMERKQTII